MMAKKAIIKGGAYRREPRLEYAYYQQFSGIPVDLVLALFMALFCCK